MKKVFLLAFILLLSFPTITLATELPKEFLGRWEPISSGAAAVALDIRDDGLIYEVSTKSGKFLRVSPYRFVANKAGKLYLLVNYFTGDRVDVGMWVFSIRKTSTMQKLDVYMPGCNYTTDDFVRLTTESLKTFPANRLCPNGKPPEDMQSSGMIFGR